jgi:group II intron reverse transcriptase/maturase
MNHRVQSNTATKLLQISKVSQADRKYKFTSLASLLNEDYLRECYARLDANKASGVDRVSVKAYGENLEDNLRNLRSRMKSMSYRPQSALRVYIPKANGAKRPLGIPATEDKIVQLAIAGILEAIYEPYFINESYGFRRGRGCHDALKRLNDEIMRNPVNYVIDADIKGFFDNVDHKWMIKFIEHRVKDKNLVRLIARFLKSGYIEEGEYMKTETGTPQGGNISPILANIYLHYVLDLWFKNIIKKELSGYAEIIRYADDFVILVEKESECVKILEQLRERLEKFGLTLSEAKTKMISFGRNAGIKGEGNKEPGTFDFLGFTHFCSRTRSGGFKVGRKTSKSRFRQKITAMNEYMRKCRNMFKLPDLWKKLEAKIRGHYQYYGVSENLRGLSVYYRKVVEIIFKWINRRSQRKSMTWKGFARYIKLYPLPRPRIYVSFYK